MEMIKANGLTPDQLIEVLSSLPPEVRARPLEMSVNVDDGSVEIVGIGIWEFGEGLKRLEFSDGRPPQTIRICPDVPFGTLEIMPGYGPDEIKAARVEFRKIPHG